MARLARVVAPGVPHHVTQRGNRRQQTFFNDEDYALYRELIAESCRAAGVSVWAYCLMPNHVHLILTPSDPDGLRAALGEAHRRYSRHVNFREGWRGYLWQGRFASAAMDERHLMACARYVEMNPVRARLAVGAEDWPWSSARAHLAATGDGLVDVRPLLDRAADWRGVWTAPCRGPTMRPSGAVSARADRWARPSS
jgi:putative transposase